ncbi:MAG: hypothetical protein M1827_001575 [Pycnora praestabilis]|nr:MAG: hypothetical protein M1827_001575 [Pycnora praestabilis]
MRTIEDSDHTALNAQGSSGLAPTLPSLPYNLNSRRRSIAINFSIILLTACVLPVLLYYILYNCTTLKTVYIFSIVTGAEGVFTLVDVSRRTYLLLRQNDDSRPLGGDRWTIDFFHFNYVLNIAIITALFVAGTASQTPHLKLIALPVPYLLTYLSTEFIVFTTISILSPSARTPVRISSIPPGAPLRPPVYTIIEDIVAVNGGGGKAYRQALDDRYLASPLFRKMLAELSLFWGIGGFVVGIVLIVLIGTIDEQVVYGLAWAVPWIWVAACTPLTIGWVRRRLAQEKASWKRK